MIRAILFLSLLGLMGACAGREAQPIQVTRADDARLSCEQINAEITANNSMITSLMAEEDDKRAQNIIAGAAGIILFAPALLAMDFQDAAGTEREALQQRQFYLGSLASQRCGGAAPLIAASSAPQTSQQPAPQQASDPATSAAAQPEPTSTATQPEPASTDAQAAEQVAAETRATLATPSVPGSPPLFEGSSYAAFSPEQIQAYCQQNWDTRIGPNGRTEYNPCKQRSAFR